MIPFRFRSISSFVSFASRSRILALSVSCELDNITSVLFPDCSEQRNSRESPEVQQAVCRARLRQPNLQQFSEGSLMLVQRRLSHSTLGEYRVFPSK